MESERDTQEQIERRMEFATFEKKKRAVRKIGSET